MSVVGPDLIKSEQVVNFLVQGTIDIFYCLLSLFSVVVALTYLMTAHTCHMRKTITEAACLSVERDMLSMPHFVGTMCRTNKSIISIKYSEYR